MSPARATDDLTEFYRELALLAASDLPLPESIEAVASGCGHRGFREVLSTVAEEVRRGSPLADALKPHPRYFPAFYTALLRTGEQAGALPEALHEAAQIAHRSRAMGLDFREIIAYPAATTWFAATVLLVMMRFYLPDFGHDMAELLETPLPPVSAFLIAAAELVTRHWALVVIFYGACLCATFWLFCDGRRSRAMLQRLLRYLPGTRRVVECLDLARVCGVSSALTARHTPMPTVLSVAAGMAEDRHLADRLQAVAQQCELGQPLAASVDAAGGLPQTLALVLRHTHEGHLADELLAMRDHYLDLAGANARKVGLAWQLAALLGMGLVTGVVVLSMFMPLIDMYRHMTAT